MSIAIDTVDNFKNLLLEQVFIKKHMNCNHEFEQVRSTYKMCVCIRREKCLEIEVKTKSPNKLWQQTQPNLEIRFFSGNSPSSLSVLHPVTSSVHVAGELEGGKDLLLHLGQVVHVRGSILFFLLLQLLLRRDPRMALLFKAPGTNTVYYTLFEQQISRSKYFASPSLEARKSFFEAFFVLFFFFFLDSW